MTATSGEECRSCKSVSGIERVSPGPFIHQGRYWVVDHAYPTALAGWLVIVLKRHCEALHELSREEFSELAELQYATVQALYSYFNCAKEYTMLFAEAPGFRHLHFHVVPRAADLPADLKGIGIMRLLKPNPEDAIAPTTISTVSQDLSHFFL